MTDLDRARALIDELGTPYHAGQIFNQRLAAAGIDYRLDKSGMSRIYKGEAKPALVAFVCLVLSQAAGEFSAEDLEQTGTD